MELMRHGRRLTVAVVSAAAGAVVLAAGAWACIAGPTLDVKPRQVTPGSEVTLEGVSYNRNPVVVRFNTMDGPVLATLQTSGGTATSSNWNLNGKVTIPADTKPGNYVLIATQPSTDGKLTQIPTRGLVQVIGSGTAPVAGAPLVQPVADRPPALARGESVSTGARILVGLGVAGFAMFLAGLAALFAGRRPEAVPAPVSSRK